MCFSAAYLVGLLVWLVVLCAVVAILRLLVPWLMTTLGIVADVPMRIINIIIGAIVIIALIWLCFDLITCAGMYPRMR